MAHDGLPTPGRAPVRVECRRFDTLVKEGVVELGEVGLMWLDAQGHEPFVLAGATSALEAGIPMVMEYTPAALRARGALDGLMGAIRDNYTTVIDLHLLAAGIRSKAVLDARDIGRLGNSPTKWEHTDLLIVRLANRTT